jgi:phosphate transport system substrate-binding protein
MERAKLHAIGGPGMTCAGADTMQALARSWADSFNRAHPSMPVALDRSTRLSAEGFERLLAGAADCVTFVREPFPAELEAYKAKFGGAPLVLNVAGGSYATRGGTHAIAVYVNAANPLGRLTLEQLDAIFSQERRRGGGQALRSWGQLGLEGEWAARPIHLYGMLRRRDSGNPPGIVNFLRRRVLLGGEFRDDLREQTDQPGEPALAAIVHRVAEDPGGIGFSGFGFAEPGVKSLSLAESAAARDYPGTPETVASRLYPLSRSLYLMVRPAEGGSLSAPQRAFLDSVLAEAGQRAVASDPMGFLPLTPSQLAAAKGALGRYPAP